jgi:hypothetical protein
MGDTLSLAVIGCSSSGIHTVILLSLLPLSVEMTVLPVATAAHVQPAEEQDLIGSGRIAALYYRSSTLHQIREHIWCVYF